MNDGLLERLPDCYRRIKERAGQRIVGMEEVLDLLVSGIFCGAHSLLVGVPGLAKTRLVNTISELLGLDFSRIQFTPDLMPSDIVGTEVIVEDADTGAREFRFMQGPVFCNILLADEINRTPPKTQAALMEAMEELQVTTSGHRHAIEEPFFVLATQNPIEQEGTYPLPAAQLDRFAFMIHVDYPSRDEEYRVIRMTTAPSRYEPEVILTRDEIREILQAVRTRNAPPEVVSYATTLARTTRPDAPEAPDLVRRYLSWGVGPRGAQWIVLAAKVRALLSGRQQPNHDDVRALAPAVFRHRMIRNFHAEAEGISVDSILEKVIASTPENGRRAVGASS